LLLYCDVEEESNRIPGEEQIYLPVKKKKKKEKNFWEMPNVWF